MFWSSFRRLWHTVAVLVRHGAGYVVGGWLGRSYVISSRLRVGLTGPQRLRTLIEELGGTFIKFGQMLALQPDRLSLEYCNALLDLLDRMPPFSFEQVEDIFLEELGRKPSEIFDSFERQPVATGSIGQVHVASLGDHRLAVKVRRPTVANDFAIDIRLMSLAIKLIKRARLRKLYWLIEPIAEFASWTGEELDYRREARYLEELGRNARENPYEHVPAVLWGYTTKCILTLEYLDALTVLDYIRARTAGSDLEALRRQLPNFDPHRFAQNIIKNFLGDAFRNGIFHADLHPANLLIMTATKVGYIDFGIVGVLSPYSRHHLIAMTVAYARCDLDCLSASFFRVSVMGKDSDAESFRSGLKLLAKEWYGTTDQEPHLRKSLTSVMLGLLTLSRLSGIWPQRDVIKYIRSAIVLDGLIKKLAPDLNVGQQLEIVCDHALQLQALTNLLSPDEQPSLNRLLLPAEDRRIALQELTNMSDAVRSFGLASAIPEVHLAGSETLKERIQSVTAMGRYHSLWAMEGLGFSEAEAAWEKNLTSSDLITKQVAGSLPASSIAALRVGISLSFAKRLLNSTNCSNKSSSLNGSLNTFLDLCERNCPEGQTGMAVDGLGLVVRMLYPWRLLDVDRELQEIDAKLLGYFWHGVGRGIYFIFPRALYSHGLVSTALEQARREPPHELGRLNALAGLAWPLTLVNIRHPEIIAAFLKQHGSELAQDGAFSNGIATSILLWLAWAGWDPYLARLYHHQPDPSVSELGALWTRLVRDPCREVMKCHSKSLSQTERFGEIFQYQPLPALADRLRKPIDPD